MARWFSLLELLLVLAACLLWFVGLGRLTWEPLLLLLFPYGTRLLAGRFPLRRTPVDWWLLLFLATAVTAVFRAYDTQQAAGKFFILLGGILLFYALANLSPLDVWTAIGGTGVISAGVAGYFLLTNDWQMLPADFDMVQRWALRWMALRPSFDLPPLFANMAGGILAMLAPLQLALAWRAICRRRRLWTAASLAAGIVALAGLFLTSSRAAWFALVLALVLGLLWPVGNRIGARSGRYGRLAFWLILLLLTAFLAAALPLLDRLPASQTTVSRMQLIRDTLYLIGDYPFLGAGLAAFGGLYSQYMAVTPFFQFSYGHFFWLDLLLEQGVLGLVSWLGVYIGARWLLLHQENAPESHDMGLARWAVAAAVFTMLIHTLFDDPLYAFTGTPLLFLLPGLGVAISSLPEAAFLMQRERRGFRAAVGGLAIVVALAVFAFWQPLQANWFAEQGAVVMARVELQGWPTGRWDDGRNATALAPPVALFERALAHDPANRTAHHRLGLIAMLQREYETAASHLQHAYTQAPDHRGIAKSLGYSYVWLGEYEAAALLLAQVPEAAYELSNYRYWWRENGRDDLARRAEEMETFLSAHVAGE